MTSSANTYDYIVVGAGSAGCVVARRLSDNPDLRVLLLEAGPPADDFWIRTPAGMGVLFKSERYNWRFQTEPVPTLRDRQLYWPRGKTLGGTSAINGMVYIRGNRRDYDGWAQLGNTGWAWDDVLPYFKRSERYQHGAGPFHGGDGLLAVSDQAVKHPCTVDYIEAARRTGLPVRDDFNTGEQDGVGFLHVNIDKGIRQSTYEAFIAPVRQRPNLAIRTGVHVRRVRFEGKVAIGVEVQEADGTVQTLTATREVIVSAGALGSPHLLMLSGVGDGEALRQYSIDTVVHAPGVGKNLQDHFVIRVQAETTRESSYNCELTGWRKYIQGLRYLLTSGGYLAMPSTTSAAYVCSGPDVGYADIQLSFRPMTFTYSDAGGAQVDRNNAVMASVYRVRPASRGEIALRSSDPLQSPAFMPNYLSEAEDVQAMLSGVRQLRKIFATEPMASRIVRELLPGPGVQTDDQWIDFMQREGSCAFHPVGTCKMGSDSMAVVDERLRVRGVERLRVVDASIMPNVISGNTNGPTIMIGEKGADMVRADLVPARVAS